MAKKAKRVTKSGRATGVTPARTTRSRAAKNVRDRSAATTATKRRGQPAASGRSASRPAKAGREAPPLRGVLRGTTPRSPKAPALPGIAPSAPFARRRTKSGYGLRAGATLWQAPPGPRYAWGATKPRIAGKR